MAQKRAQIDSNQAKSSKFTQERQREILDELTRSGRVEVPSLATEFGVSEATVRRDLAALSAQGYLQKTYGGAVTLDAPKLGWAVRAGLRSEEKARIGAAAVSFIEPSQSVILDAGSTNFELAVRIEVRPLTVITNSLDIAAVFEGDREVALLLTGGEWDPVVRHLNGPPALAMLELCRADWTFLGATGVHSDAGVTSAYLDNAAVKRAMVAASPKTVVMADHTKIGEIGPHFVTSLDKVHAVVTDDRSAAQSLKASGVSVIH